MFELELGFLLILLVPIIVGEMFRVISGYDISRVSLIVVSVVVMVWLMMRFCGIFSRIMHYMCPRKRHSGGVDVVGDGGTNIGKGESLIKKIRIAFPFVDATLTDMPVKNGDIVVKDNSNSSSGVAKEGQSNSPIDLGGASSRWQLRPILFLTLKS